MTFDDRGDELTALETAFDSSGHDFYVVYGRRRVGKTEPLKEFCSELLRPTRRLRRLLEGKASFFDDATCRYFSRNQGCPVGWEFMTGADPWKLRPSSEPQ